MRFKFLAALCLAGCMAAAPSAQAGRSCEKQAPRVDAVTRGLALAERVVQRLDAAGVNVALLARAGQDLSAYSLRYSHLGLAYKDGQVWRVMP